MSKLTSDEKFATLTLEQCADSLISGHSSSMAAYHIGLRIKALLPKPIAPDFEWCPCCREYHDYPIGEKTDYGTLVKDCPRSPYPPYPVWRRRP